MSDPRTEDSGLLASIRRFFVSLLGLAQNRLELFAVEFQAERLRLLDRLFWLAIALAVGLIGLILATVTLALFLWQTTGFLGLVGLAALFLVVSGVLLLRLRNQLRDAPLPFSETIAEFKKDCSCLQDRN